ncbi:MAG: hypothetical protein ACRD26_12855 [Vicinamibacterales bacterium]
MVFDDRLIFDPVEPDSSVSACGKCGKCGKSAGGLEIENDLDMLRRHIYRNPEILRDIMRRWDINPTLPPASGPGGPSRPNS